MDAITALTTRNSAARLGGQAPDEAARERIFAAALRAPDHGFLRPWRFLVVEDDARHRLGETLAEVARAADPEIDEKQLVKLRNNPLRAPLVVIVVARTREHPKIPRIEQILSAGAAAENMLVAAHALGYGAMWRTGFVTYLPALPAALGLEAEDTPVGFLYMGELIGDPKPIPDARVEDYFVDWNG